MADKQIKVTLRLDGIQEFKSQLKAVSASAKDVKADFKAFGDSLATAATNMAKIAAAAVGASAAIVKLTLDNAKQNEELLKLSQQTGVASDKLQELQFIGNQVGISSEAQASAFEKFSIALAKARTPSKDLGDLQEKLAKAQRNLAKITGDAGDAYDKTVDSVKKHAEAIRKQNIEIKNYNAANPKHRKSLKDVASGSDKVSDAQERMRDRIESARENVIEARKALDEYDEGEGNLAKTLSQINPVLLERVKAASNAGDAFDILIDGVRELNSVEEQNLVIGSAFGKGNLDFAQFARASKGELAELRKEFLRLGGAIDKGALEASDELGDTVDKLKFAFNNLKNNLLNEFQPAVAVAAEEITAFIVANRGTLLKFATDVIPKVMSAVGDLFLLIQKGGDVKNPNETALNIFNTFKAIKDAIDLLIPPMAAVFEIFDKFAKLVGFTSGQTAAFTILILRATGVLTVFTTGIKLLLSNFVLLLSTLKLIRTFLLTNLLAITGWGAAISIAAGLIFAIIDATIGWEEANILIKEFFTELVALAPFIFQEIVNELKVLGQTISDIFFGIPDFIRNILGPDVSAAWIEMIDALLLGLDHFATEALAFLLSIDWTLIGKQLEIALALAITIFNGWFDKIKESAKTFGISVGNLLVDGITFAFNELPKIVSSIFSDIKNNALAVINSIKSPIDTLKNIFGGATRTNPDFIGPRFAGGGQVQGIGSGTSDSNLAWLSHGEFVVRAAAVRKYGVGLLHALNNGMLGVKGFASGGLADFTSSLSDIASPSLQPSLVNSISSSSSGRPLTLVLPSGRKIQTKGIDDGFAKSLEKELRGSANAKSMQLPDWYSGS